MRGFLIATGLLVANTTLCGLSVFSAQSALLAVGMLSFVLLLWAHGYITARAGIRVGVQVEQRRNRAAPERVPAAPAQSRLKRVTPREDIA